MDIGPIYEEFERYLDVIQTIRITACCKEVLNEHLSIIFNDMKEDFKMELTTDIKENLAVLRKLILEDKTLTPEQKLDLYVYFV